MSIWLLLKSKVGMYAAGALAGLIFLAGLFFKVKNMGRKEVEGEVNKKTAEVTKGMVKKVKKNEDEIRSDTVASKRDKLRKYTSKPNN